MLRICRHVSPSSRDFRAMTEVGDWFSMPLSQALYKDQMLHLKEKFGAFAVDNALGNAWFNMEVATIQGTVLCQEQREHLRNKYNVSAIVHTIGDGRKVYLSCGTPDNIHVCAAEAMKFISMNRMRPAHNDEVDVQEEHNIMLTMFDTITEATHMNMLNTKVDALGDQLREIEEGGVFLTEAILMV